MKQKLIFLLFLIGIALSIFGILKFVVNRAPKPGVLKVNSQPVSGIFLDSKHIGKTPFEDKISEGDFTIKLVPESTVTTVVPWQGRISVKPNLLTYVNADLSDSEFTSAIDILWLEKSPNKNSEITVTTDPDGATITLDGEQKGFSPIAIPNVQSGDHTILVSSPGFLSRQLKIKTHEGYKLIASLKLALATGAAAATSPATDSAQISPTLAATNSASIKPNITTTVEASPTASLLKKLEVEPTKPYIIISDTPTGFLRVRSGPSTVNTTEVGRVKPGDKYSILKYDENNWYEIKFSGTTSGWVSGQYVEKIE